MKNKRLILSVILILTLLVISAGASTTAHADQTEALCTEENEAPSNAEEIPLAEDHASEDNSGEVDAPNEEADSPVSNENGSGSSEQGANNVDLPEYGENGRSEEYSENVFEEIYQALEQNADKLFSILAFIGTLIVGIGYKSGLLPLLRDAIGKLKGAIDGVRADGEVTKAKTDEGLYKITSALERLEEDVAGIKGVYESYGEVKAERETIRLVLLGQIDMLYSIFMTSALPQYQKDEIGEKISQMKEELKNYEEVEEN